VNHLAEQVDVLAGIFFQSAVTDFDGVFYTITETEMARYIKSYGTEINIDRRKVLLARIFLLSGFFDAAGYRRTVVGGYVKLFDRR
jgi:hypothetical protein